MYRLHIGFIYKRFFKSRIVQKPEEYRCSSYPAFIGKTKVPEWLETGWLLSSFGKEKKAAMQNYKAF
ncbi:MAG: hypothetical protein DRH10_06735, partial [Deltaproteobacteria bacterium]